MPTKCSAALPPPCGAFWPKSSMSRHKTDTGRRAQRCIPEWDTVRSPRIRRGAQEAEPQISPHGRDDKFVAPLISHYSNLSSRPKRSVVEKICGSAWLPVFPSLFIRAVFGKKKMDFA